MTTVPKDLNESGKRLWTSITADYELRNDEIEILHSACRIRDVIDELTAGLVGEPLTVLGGQRQVVIHPLIQEKRYEEQALAGLLAKLKFHDSVETTVLTDGARKMTRSESGRKAAKARWSRARGGA